jgi:hypothetical protein
MEGLTIGGIGAIDNAVTETTTDATPRTIAAFDANGLSNRVTPDHATNDLTITEAGTYDIQGHVSFEGTLSKTFKVQVYVNEIASGVPLERKLGTGGDVGSASFCSIAVCAIGDKITARHWSTDGGVAFTAKQISLVATRVF